VRQPRFGPSIESPSSCGAVWPIGCPVKSVVNDPLGAAEPRRNRGCRRPNSWRRRSSACRLRRRPPSTIRPALGDPAGLFACTRFQSRFPSCPLVPKLRVIAAAVGLHLVHNELAGSSAAGDEILAICRLIATALAFEAGPDVMAIAPRRTRHALLAR